MTEARASEIERQNEDETRTEGPGLMLMTMMFDFVLPTSKRLARHAACLGTTHLLLVPR